METTETRYAKTVDGPYIAYRIHGDGPVDMVMVIWAWCHATVRAFLGRHRAIEVVTTDDGFFATFDGAARALRCAPALYEAVDPLGIEITAGVRTGEIAIRDGNAGGESVGIGARVAALADPVSVLVSSTVKDLVAGSGPSFDDAGEHGPNGVPGSWHPYRVPSG